MEEIKEVGKEVLIFNSNDKIYPVGKGVIINNTEMMEDLLLYGPGYKVIYYVKCKDDTVIRGTYGNNYINNTFFRTKEDYLKFLKTLVNLIINEINGLVDEANEYLNIINSVDANNSAKKLKKVKVIQ